ncbi:MAG: exo-alpha-sialidase [Fibrobacterota bacterium]|nr:exo-alpha-sialidase [Fibrobacterota bacterium]QQS03316.1 MAG: exo-alpha-sialidase [Fibrobacterota bacterium]
MKIVTSLFLALAMAPQAASIFPKALPQELKFPAYGQQNTMIVNEDRRGTWTFLAGGWNGLVQFQGYEYTGAPKTWSEKWDSKTLTEIGFPLGVMGLARSKSLFMAVGNSQNQTTYDEEAPRYAISKDGLTWTTHAGTTPGWMSSLAYGDRTWVATGSKSTGIGEWVGQIQYSKDDGASWQSVVLGDRERLERAFWNGSLWVAVGEKRMTGMGGAFLETRIYTSVDGVRWTLRSSPGTVTLNSVVWGHGKWVAVGESYPHRGTPCPIILNSDDGISWTDVSPLADENGFLTDVDTTMFGFIAVGHRRVIHSFDGVQWEPVYANPTPTFRAVKTIPFGREGSEIYLLADTGRAFQDTLPEIVYSSSMGLPAHSQARDWKIVGNRLHVPEASGPTIELSLARLDGGIDQTFSAQVDASGTVGLPSRPGVRILLARANSGKSYRSILVGP